MVLAGSVHRTIQQSYSGGGALCPLSFNVGSRMSIESELDIRYLSSFTYLKSDCQRFDATSRAATTIVPVASIYLIMTRFEYGIGQSRTRRS